MMETCFLSAPTGKFLPMRPSHSLSIRISPVTQANNNRRVLIYDDFKGLLRPKACQMMETCVLCAPTSKFLQIRPFQWYFAGPSSWRKRKGCHLRRFQGPFRRFQRFCRQDMCFICSYWHISAFQALP